MSKEKSNKTQKKFEKPIEFDNLLKDLKEKLGVVEKEEGKYSYTKPKIFPISDVLDENNRQYVDLVQKGGGVWGIALIGFTYVLEEVGIRFLRLAGTSAGSINTVLLAAIGNKEDKKSEKILKLLAEKDIFDFVDGHKIVKKFISFFIKHQNNLKLLIAIPIIYFVLLLSGIFFLISPYATESNWTIVIFFLISFLFIIPLVLVAFVLMLYKRMGQAGLGLNPGEDFLFWLREVLWENNRNVQQDFSSKNIKDRIYTTKELEEKVKLCPPLYLIENKDDKIDDLTGDITVITAELVTQNKIELPRMKDLFKSAKNYQPFEDAAEMVRASMAIPIFFESFYARNIDKYNTKSSWEKCFAIEPPDECRFVDGGVMSNFPIDIYYNQNISRPRLPTIGIDLQEDNKTNFSNDEISSGSNHTSNQWKLFDFAGKLFNASRNYYDKDFIQKNRILQKSIAKVPIKGISWLDFGIGPRQKEELFMMGAKAAYKFLWGDEWNPKAINDKEEKAINKNISEESKPGRFNWAEYKDERQKLKEIITSNTTKK